MKLFVFAVFYCRFLSISIPTMATTIIIATAAAMTTSNIAVLSGAAVGGVGVGDDGAAVTPMAVSAYEAP